jgi:hypothetical protein
VTSVSVARFGRAEKLFVTDIFSWSRYDCRSDVLETRVNSSSVRDNNDISDSYATSIAPLDDRNVVFADSYADTVLFGTIFGYQRFLSERPVDSPGTYGGSFGNHRGGAFDAPGGIATDGAGNVYIADSGNKRIRVMSHFNTLSPGDPDIPARVAGRREFRVAVIGNSFVWTTAPPSETIAGRLESLLNSAPEIVARHEIAKVYSVNKNGTDLVLALPGRAHDDDSPIEQFIDSFLLDGEVDEVVYVMDYPTGFIDRPVMNQASAILKRINATLRSHNVRFGIVVVPFSHAVSPLGNSFCDIASAEFSQACGPAYPHGIANYSDAPHQRELAAAIDSGADVFDAFDAFVREVATPDHRPLFHAKELHPNSHANDLIAETIAASIFSHHDFATSTDRFTSAELNALTETSGPALGDIESFDPTTGIIRGWAGDPHEEAAARGVFLIVNNEKRIDLTPFYGFERPDVVTNMMMPALAASGFQGKIDTGIRAGKNTLELCVISYDHRHFWLLPKPISFDALR